MTLNDDIPTFGERTHSLGTALNCPNCGEDFLHQTGVEVYKRHAEDADHGLSATINQDLTMEVAENASTEAGNPSGRRDGIRIRFACEHCTGLEDVAELVITQHKGNEFVRWDPV